MQRLTPGQIGWLRQPVRLAVERQLYVFNFRKIFNFFGRITAACLAARIFHFRYHRLQNFALILTKAATSMPPKFQKPLESNATVFINIGI